MPSFSARCFIDMWAGWSIPSFRRTCVWADPPKPSPASVEEPAPTRSPANSTATRCHVWSSCTPSVSIMAPFGGTIRSIRVSSIAAQRRWRSAPSTTTSNWKQASHSSCVRNAYARVPEHEYILTPAEEHADHGPNQTQSAEDGCRGDGHGSRGTLVWSAVRTRSERHVLLRKRPGAHPLSGDRLRLPAVTYSRRRIELGDRRFE